MLTFASSIQLTPFVSSEIEKPPTVDMYDGGQRFTPPLIDPKGFLRTWRTKNLAEYHEVLEHQKQVMGTNDDRHLLEDDDYLPEEHRIEQQSQQESVPWYKRPFVKSRTLVVDEATPTSKAAAAPVKEEAVAERPRK